MIINQSRTPPLSPKSRLAGNSCPTVVNSVPSFPSLCFLPNFLCWKHLQSITIPESVHTRCVYEQNIESVIMLATMKLCFYTLCLSNWGPINLSFTEMFSAEIMLMHGDANVTFTGKVLKYDHSTGIDSSLPKDKVI